MLVDGERADAQLVGDLLVRLPSRDMVEDGELAEGEAVEVLLLHLPLYPAFQRIPCLLELLFQPLAQGDVV